MHKKCQMQFGIVRLAAVIVSALAAVSCSPTYAVYNGGLEKGEFESVKTVADLKPSEAVVSFNSDYAPPQPNEVYGGPTNRVKSDVPEDLLEHKFMRVSTSRTVRGMIVVEPTSKADSAGSASSNVDVNDQPHIIADRSVTGVVSSPEQGLSVTRQDALRTQVRPEGRMRADVNNTVGTTADMTNVTQRTDAEYALGLGAVEAALESQDAHQPWDANTVEGAGGYMSVRGSETSKGTDVGGQITDNVVPKGQGDITVAQGAANAGQLMGAGMKTAVKGEVTSHAGVVRTAAGAPEGFGDSSARNLAAERMATSEIRSPENVLATLTKEGLISFTRQQLKARLETSEATQDDASPKTLSGYASMSVAEGLGTAANPLDVTQANSPMDATTADAAAGGINVNALNMDSDLAATLQVTVVAPPHVSVLKRTKVFTLRGVDLLVSEGVLKELPGARVVIGYQIILFNEGDSAASDIKVIDRIPAGTRLILDSIYSSSEDASAKYDADAQVLAVTLGRLDSLEIFVTEFYVEPVQAP